MALALKKGFGFAGGTQTAGTVITALVQPVRRMWTVLTTLIYTSAGTAHSLALMKPLSRGITTQAQVAGDTLVKSTTELGAAATNPATGAMLNAAAANDYIAVRLDNGRAHLSTISSVSTTSGVTTYNLNTAIPTGRSVPANARIWYFGLTSDGHPILKPAVSVTSTKQDVEAGLLSSDQPHDPLLVISDNITAAGNIEVVSGGYFSRAR